jgi:hypothetical protein
VRAPSATNDGVSSQHGRGGSKAKEFDLLLPGAHGHNWLKERGFQPFALIN